MAGSTKALFLDIGGVLLTNGWDRGMRQNAVEKFGLENTEFHNRHELFSELLELGKIDLDDYLQETVFYEPRTFSKEEFKNFIFEQSKPFAEMIDWIKELKKGSSLKICTISNEGRELADFRNRKFHLTEFIDTYLISSFVQLRKPDKAFYHLALNLTQVTSEEGIYVDDREIFVEIARQLGFKAIHHKNFKQTAREMEHFI